jgi:hypothetical protein
MNPAVTLSDDQLLGLLHAADPLPRTPSPETDAIWARIAAGLTAEPCLSTTPVRRRAAGLRRRPVLVAAACATAFAALGITLSLHGTSGVSLAERAYAQATLPGIAHWRAAIDVFHAGALASSEREEGWAANGVSHTILTNGASVTERRVAHGEETFRGPGGELGQGAASRTDLDRALPGADPFAAFREAPRSGKRGVHRDSAGLRAAERGHADLRARSADRQASPPDRGDRRSARRHPFRGL